MNFDPERLSYLANLLTVIVLGAALLYALALATEGKLGSAVRALAGRKT